MKRILFFGYIALFIGCSSPRFYKELKSTRIKIKNKEIINENVKIVFQTLKNELKNSSHIIFFMASDRIWYSAGYTGLLYNVENNKTYYIIKDAKKWNKITIDTIIPEYHAFVMDNYRKGNISYLQTLGNESKHSGIRSTELIFDIDLNTNEIKKYLFKDFILDNEPYFFQP